MARSRALLNVLNLANQEELSIERQFLNDLQASIERDDAKGKRKPSKTYKPSSLHCIRNMYYQVSGVEVKANRSSSELVGICQSGTDRHERLQKVISSMRDNGADCVYCDVGKYIKTHNLLDDIDIISKQGMETKLFHKKYNMSFLCDGIIRYKGKYYILEIKTETSNKFWDRSNVNPDHILQGTAYSLAFHLDNVLFLYECRDNCSKKAFMLNVTDEMRDKLIEKINTCNDYLAKNEVPPKPLDLSRSTCAYCNYAERCKKDV